MIKPTSFGYVVYHPLGKGKIYHVQKWLDSGFSMNDVKRAIDSFLLECQEEHLDTMWNEPFYLRSAKSAALAMVLAAKQADIKKQRPYKLDDFIDEDFIYELCKLQHNECEYCGVKMNWENRTQNCGATIERLDNTKPHIKSNCVLSCFQCNLHTSHT